MTRSIFLAALCLLITVSVSVHAATSTFGYTGIGSVKDTGDSNYINAWKFTTSAIQSGIIVSMSVYVAGPVSAAPNNQFQVALYADAGGGPGSLLASSTSSTIVPNAWNTISFNAPLSPNTSYWLAYNTHGSGASYNNVPLDVSGSGISVWQARTFGSWPTTFGAAQGSSNQRGSIYVTYTPSGTLDIILPTVSLTAPASGPTVSGASVTVSAQASDNVGVVGVQFKLDGNNLGTEDTTSPYAITWNTTTTSNGPHTLTAVARDAVGNTTTATGVSVTVNNVDTTAPSVPQNLTATAMSTSQINLAWSASTDNASVTGYRIYRSGTQIATAASTSYSVTGLLPATLYAFTVAAYDAAGNVSGQSNIATANTFAAPDTTPPTVVLTAPLNGATVSGTITMAANTSDNVGVAGVQFKLDGNYLGVEQTTTPYSISWDSKTVTNGAHTFTAVARDAAGNSTNSSAVAVTVHNQTPSASLACNAPQLPITGTRTVNVSTETQLQSAVANAQPGDTIVIANGTYNLSSTLYVNGKNHLTIRGTSGCDGVVLVGRGMDNANYGNVLFGIWSNSLSTIIAHLTIRDTYDNTIIFNAGAQSPHVYSVKLLNAGSQFVKANPTDPANGIGVDNGVIEYSWIEYTAGPPTTNHGSGVGYTNGLSAHTADNWIISNNVFKNSHTPDSAAYLWNPAVLMWNHSQHTITENNVFINVDRAIAYGINNQTTGTDHFGGTIRNNFVYYTPGLMSAARTASSDGAIIAWDSPSTKIYHNTIITSGNVVKAIEFRFATNGAEARNNLADAPIGSRDGATFVQSGNYLSAVPSMFVNPTAADLHLVNNSATQTYIIDRAPSLPAVVSDIDGNARPQGTGYDIGADELVP